MIDLRKLAVLLIYQDGSIDDEKVELDMFHLPYFRRLKKRSKKFRKVIKDLDLNRCNHNDIFLHLARMGVIEIFNHDLAKIVACPDILKSEFVPYFVVSIPQEFISVEQKLRFYDVIREYNSSLLYFGQWNGKSYIDDELIRERILNDDLMNKERGR